MNRNTSYATEKSFSSQQASFTKAYFYYGYFIFLVPAMEVIRQF